MFKLITDALSDLTETLELIVSQTLFEWNMYIRNCFIILFILLVLNGSFRTLNSVSVHVQRKQGSQRWIQKRSPMRLVG